MEKGGEGCDTGVEFHAAQLAIVDALNLKFCCNTYYKTYNG